MASKGCRAGVASFGADNRGQQKKRGDELAEHLAWAAAQVGRDLQQRQLEHAVRDQHANETVHDLDWDIGRGFGKPDLAASGKVNCHRWVEMRTRQGSEDENQHRKSRACCKRIAEQCDRRIPICQMLGHDARADHHGDKESRSNAFGRQAPAQTCQRLMMVAGLHLLGQAFSRFFWPISRTCRWMARRSRRSRGKAAKILRRFSI